MPAMDGAVRWSVEVPPVQRRYRISPGPAGFRLTLSQPNAVGSRSFSVTTHADPAAARAACLAALLDDCARDMVSPYAAFSAAYWRWQVGSRGIRPRSAAARLNLERLANAFCRTIEAYAAAYLSLVAAADAAQQPLPPHEHPPHLQSGIDAVVAGEAGKLVRVQDLVGRITIGDTGERPGASCSEASPPDSSPPP